MPWSSEPEYLGFSSARPWLPFGANHSDFAVDLQEAAGQSLLNFTRRCLQIRNRHPALRYGAMDILEASAPLLVFEREEAGRRFRCSFNLSGSPTHRTGDAGHAIISAGEVSADRLGPWAAVIEGVE